MSDVAGPSTVVVFSQRSEVCSAVRTVLGEWPAADVGPVRYLECRSGAEVIATVDAGGVDLCVLDGEAEPTGGVGLSRRLRADVADCPALVVLLTRGSDGWLARWSQADAALAFPVDPAAGPAVVAGLLLERAAERPVLRASTP